MTSSFVHLFLRPEKRFPVAAAAAIISFAALATPSSEGAPTTSAATAAAVNQAAKSSSPTEQLLARIENELEKGIKPSDQTFEQLGALIDREPNNETAHLVLGMCYEAMGLPAQAIEQYGAAMRLAPSDPRPLIDQAYARIRMGQGAEVSTMILLAYKKFPANPDVMFLYGYDLVQHNQWQEAIQVLAEVRKKRPEMPFLNGTLAQCELLSRPANYRLALAFAELELDRCARHKERPYPKALMVKGLALANLGLFAESVNPLGQAFIDMPKDTQLSGMCARMAIWSGRYADALPPILGNLAYTSSTYVDNELMHKYLVDCIRHTTKDQALSTINEISTKLPDAQSNAGYQNAVGQALSQCGMHDAAIEHFQRAIKVQHDYARALFNLGQEYELYKHNYDQALDCYRKAQQYNVPGVQVGDYVARLEERLPNRKNDLAWQLKDWLTGNSK